MTNRKIRAGIFIVVFLITGCAPRAHAPAFQSGYARVNGLRLYYEIHGSDTTQPPLVLLHGGGSTIQTSFGKLLPGLAKERRIIALEQQGHGHTADIPGRPFTFEQSADDTVALLTYLNVRKADLMGYSNGGQIAIEIALTHPGLVRKLVVESAMFSTDGSDPAFWESFKRAKLEDMPPELREAYLKASPHPEDLPTFFAKSVKRMLEFKGWTSEEIRSITAPTLVIAGDRDVVRPEHAVLMFRLLPNAELAILPATDHMAIVDRADLIAPLVNTFLNAPMPGTKAKAE